MEERFINMTNFAVSLIQVLELRNKSYKDSWRRRGGPGIFANIARKWDRLEAKAEYYKWDILKALQDSDEFAGGDNPINDLDDLIAYLLLCRMEVIPDGGLKGPYFKTLQDKLALAEDQDTEISVVKHGLKDEGSYLHLDEPHPSTGESEPNKVINSSIPQPKGYVDQD